MNDRPLILITNDDGVEAKGIKELTECLRDLGDIVVFAPDGPRSGMASAITSLVPIKYTLVRKEKGLTVYSCTGTPVDCVKLAINEVLERKPDLLASGINHGGNHAICIQYSGTMGAAAEGCVFGIPSMENAAGDPVFWLAGAFENAKPIHADNDTLALDSGYASLVPCKIDVTDYDFLAVLKNQLKVES